jgi:hypothetical protein
LLRRQCTREYKIEPIRRYCRKLMGVGYRKRVKDGQSITMLIGISTDEAVRMKTAKDKWQTNKWPLIEMGMSRAACYGWLEKNGFGDTAKSSCTFCPYHSDEHWLDMKRNDPESFADAVRIDEAIRDNLAKTDERVYVHRSLKPLGEIDFFDLEDLGQMDLFNQECEGMCGV